MDIAEEWIGELEAQAEQVSQNTVQKKNETEGMKEEKKTWRTDPEVSVAVW